MGVSVGHSRQSEQTAQGSLPITYTGLGFALACPEKICGVTRQRDRVQGFNYSLRQGAAYRRAPASVGGHTDAAVLLRGSDKPLFIERLDMQEAEERGGNLDSLLSQFVAILMGSGSNGSKTISQLGQQSFQFDHDYTKQEFRCQFPDKNDTSLNFILDITCAKY
jgi:hypothetical protein